MILGQPELIKTLIKLLADSVPEVTRATAQILVNVSGDKRLETNEDIIKVAMGHVLEAADRDYADVFCMLLSNLTRSKGDAEVVAETLEKLGVSIERIVDMISKDEGYGYLSTTLLNLSQVSRVREQIMDEQKQIIQRLLPFTEYQGSVMKRSAVVGKLIMISRFEGNSCLFL